MPHDENIDAQDYGSESYGTGAYGRSKDARTTFHAQFPYLFGPHGDHDGDADYADWLDDAIDEIDRLVSRYGEYWQLPDPAGLERLWIDTTLEDDQPTPRVEPYVDLGSTEWDILDLPLVLPDNLLWTDRAQTVTGRYAFENDILGDLDGRATRADTADEAAVASSTDALGGHDSGEYCAADQNQTITAPWTFREQVKFYEGMDLSGSSAPLTLASYGN